MRASSSGLGSVLACVALSGACAVAAVTGCGGGAEPIERTPALSPAGAAGARDASAAAPKPSSAAPVASSAAAAREGEGAPAAGAAHSGEPGGAAVSDSERDADIKAANAFTLKLYGKMKRAQPGNLMISGTSVRQGLAIAYLGARGETAREMTTTLELPADPGKAAALARAESAAWQQSRGQAELYVANRLWADKAFPLKEDFRSAVNGAFGAAVEPVDFATAPDAARAAVNRWVAEKTADKIPDLLPEGAVDKRTRAIISNAIYFKGRWASPFPKGATKDQPFKSTPARTANVAMMHMNGNHRLAHVGAVKVLELPYEGSELAMLLVLPDDVAGLAKVEESASADTFATWTRALAAQRVAVSLPKFAFPWGGPLAAPLQELGIKSAFSSKADLTAMAPSTGAERLQISQVMHRTWVAVDEVGTEAAAATGVTMSVTSAPMGPVAEFKADHPFLFFVYEAKRGRILFAGRVNDPKP